MSNPNHRFNVIITGPPIAKKGMKLLSTKCDIECTQPYLPSPELAQMVRNKNADALLVRMGKINESVINASPNLKVIAKHGTGVDNIDIQTATRLQIPVFITPYANYESVAEHVLLLMLSLARDLPWLDARVRNGYWDKPNYRGVELKNKTLGLVGFGKIGRRIRELVVPLQMKIYIYDPFLKPESIPDNAIAVSELETLLKSSDIVSLNCPLTEKTKHLIDKDKIGLMKKSAWLINTSRGEIVNENELIFALKEERIAAAALDTFTKEPPEDIKPLAQNKRVILTPHVAGVTEESFERMGVESVKNILAVLDGAHPDLESLMNPEVLEDD